MHSSESEERSSPTRECFERAPAQLQAPDTSTEADGITTLMMYDIPYSVSFEAVSGTIDEHGFADAYDYFHMPASRGGSCGAQKRSLHLGFAIINFKTVQLAGAALDLFQNFSFPQCDETQLTKLTCTEVAKTQGMQENVQVSQARTRKARRGSGRGTH